MRRLSALDGLRIEILENGDRVARFVSGESKNVQKTRGISNCRGDCSHMIVKRRSNAWERDQISLHWKNLLPTKETLLPVTGSFTASRIIGDFAPERFGSGTPLSFSKVFCAWMARL